MNETGDGAATTVDLIESYLDRIESLLTMIRASAKELKEKGDNDGPDARD